MKDLLREATSLLESKPLLRKVHGTALVCGDIHGDLDALETVVDKWKSEGTDYLILLGDYVDRGLQQIEVVKRISELIIEEKNFIALRGNHEDYKVCSRYGFIEEVHNQNLDSEPFIEFFSHLPVAAASKKVFMCHGGIPVNPEFDLREINNYNRTYTLKDDNLIQLLWNDPIYDFDGKQMPDKNPSRRGPNVWDFGEPITDRFFSENKFELLIRAHIAFLEGSKWMQNKKILSLFTSKSGVYSPYKRHIAKLDLNKPENIEIIDITDGISN